ncbi:MAG TPA: MATE family efflux transporter [Petrimonas sp.]|nr:MATE family efflux transporter [Petrimonas sp.]
MILTMLVSLYTSRIVLNVLGVEDYGTYTIVGGVVSMFGFFNAAMASATQRFLSFELGKGDYLQLRKTFNAALVIHIGIALLIAILAETVGLWYINNYLNVPPDRMDAARWIYHFSILSFMVTVIQVPYNATIIARERMNVYAYVSILEVLLKLLIVFMLTWIAFDKLKLYGVLIFGVTVIVALIYQIYTRKHFDETRFEVVKDKALFKTLISFSGWSLFGNGALISSNQGISLIINFFQGVVLNAAIGVANQINGALYTFVANFQVAFNPQLIKTYAQNEIKNHTQLLLNSSRFSFFILLILITPIILNTDYILLLWLKIVPDYSVSFTKIILISSLIDALSGPFWTSANATGRIKYYQIGVSIILILNIPLTYIILKQGLSPNYVFISKLLLNSILYIFRVSYVNYFIKFDRKSVVEYVYKILLPIVFAFVPLYFLKNELMISETLLNLFIVALISVIYTIIVVFLVGLTSNERKLLLSFGLIKIKSI